ncbi:Phox-like protein [Mycena pura]|uniref:Phox-like protein n=1 Tax=Mycena pura TaxID=153505 RepID=A0AAD6UPS1_9AGAR|nr:Phox-like protein [Mycena pura]
MSFPAVPRPLHPFAHTTSRIEVISAGIDVEEEARLYDDIDETPTTPHPPRRPYSPPGPPSVFSNDIWLGDNVGESSTFARGVQISGWTSVGDIRGGAYVVYDCVVKTKEGTQIHAHKRYSDFAAFEGELLRTLPPSFRASVPPLPPKAPLARYRAAFLARRRRALEHWLSSVLLHPDVGGCVAARRWIVA